MIDKKVPPQPPVMTPVFRASYPWVFTPQPPMPGSDPKKKPRYQLNAIFAPGTDLRVLKQTANAAAISLFGADESKWPKNFNSPFKDGAEKDSDGYGPGTTFISPWSERRPGLVDSQVQRIIEPSEFYAGCYAQCKVSAFPWSFMGKNGVSFYLGNIQKIKDGEPLASGMTKPENDFAAIKEPGAQEGQPAAAKAGLFGA